MDAETKEPDLELVTSDSVRFGMLLVAVSVLWGILLALLPTRLRTPETILTFMLPLLVAWELGVITTHSLWQYRERVFGKLVDASTNLAVGVALTVVDFTLLGLFFLLQEDLTGALPGGVGALFATVILIGAVGYWFIYRSVRQLLATTR